MSIFLAVLICFIAGMGAGMGTGFAGMSAAAIISPVLITFLGVPAYEAVGIALASDVLASGVSAVTFAKNKNVDLKNGFVMMISVLVFTLVGSLASSFLPNSTMGNFSVFMTMVLGIKFLIKPVTGASESMADLAPRTRVIRSILAGMLVGFICGFIGAGGGMMMLLILTSILGYELKTAVGTSVFIMTFTAFTGAASHFVIGGLPDLRILLVCAISTLLWARIAAKIANKVDSLTLNRITGVILLGFGLAILFLG
ncbi:MAG: sulfite exporter TauE/SafE family protein [Lachnospiraceae bacterium]